MAATRILYCNCAFARVIPEGVKAEVLERLAAAGVAFEAVPDLCELAAKRSPALRRLAAPAAPESTNGATNGGGGSAANLRIAACYPRAVKWLFAAAGAPLPEGVEVRNMRAESAEEVVAALLRDGSGAPEGGSP